MTIVCIIVVLFIMQRCINTSVTNSGSHRVKSNSSQCGIIRNEDWKAGNPFYIYIYGIWLSQGWKNIETLVSSEGLQ